MKSQTVKNLSYVALVAGAASVVVSGGIYLADLMRGSSSNKRREGSLFIGLWAPSFFALSEMLDRISEQDDRFMGIPITERVTERGEAVPITERAKELIRR
jgi:hypothetical protein